MGKICDPLSLEDMSLTKEQMEALCFEYPIQNDYHLEAAINALEDEFGHGVLLHHVSIFFKEELYDDEATERQVRAIQLLINRKQIDPEDVKVIEYYIPLDGEDEGDIKENYILFDLNGRPINKFISSFYSFCDDMALQLLCTIY